MSLVEDVRVAFRKKGLNFVSLTESIEDDQKSILTYTDDAGKRFAHEIPIPLDQLEDAVNGADILEPTDLADFLLKYPSRPS